MVTLMNGDEETGAVFTVYDAPDDWCPPADWHQLDLSAFMSLAEVADPHRMVALADSAGMTLAGGLAPQPEE